MKHLLPIRDLIAFTTKGITPKYVKQSSIIVLNQKCIKNNRIDYSFAQYHDDSASVNKEKLLRVGDILINSTGQGTAGRCAFVKELPLKYKVIVDSHILIVRVNDFYTAGCLAYSLFSIEAVLQTFIEGSTGQGEFDKLRLFNIITGMPLKEYRKVTYVFLSSLDQKIELNNRINAELETMAKTLYDYWFVQFDFPDEKGRPYKSSGGKMVYNKILKRKIPEGWVDGTLNDLAQIVGGSTPSTKNAENYSAEGIPWITPNDLSENRGNKFISHGAQDISGDGIKAAALKKYPTGTVLLSSRAPIGYMAIARNELTTNQGFKSFIPNKGYSSAFIFYTVRLTLTAIMQVASGSTFKEISGGTLKTVKVIIPSKRIVDGFTQKVNGILEKQSILEQENKTSASLRDWLLPMLMNGQVNVG